MNEINYTKTRLTFYNIDPFGISSKYNKFSKLWWHKRFQAFSYLKYILKKKNKRFIISLDYLITKTIFYFYNEKKTLLILIIFIIFFH